MRQAVLIVNPHAGRGGVFNRFLPEMKLIFAAHKFNVSVEETTAEPSSAYEIALRASAECDLAVACGGDGTVHEVLQGLALSPCCLGVLPFGTANAFARNLGLPTDPAKALEALLAYKVREIPLGFADTTAGRRWFIVMAGAGPDGMLVHEMNLAAKARAGRAAYYTEAGRLFLTRRFPPFKVEYRAVGSKVWTETEAVAMMVSRVPDLGGIFGGLTRDSLLDHPHLTVKLLAGPAHIAFPAWLAGGALRLERANPWLTTLQVDNIRCHPLDIASGVQIQMDGEAAGILPLTLGIAPSAVRLRMPY